MANTVSAKKMTRKIAKRTAINKSRRSRIPATGDHVSSAGHRAS